MVDALDTIKILGSLLGNGALSKGSGGNVLGNILGSALGGAKQQQTQGGGALGDILGGLLGGGQQQSGSSGGMGDILGSILAGGGGGRRGSGGSGGMADILGGLIGAATKPKSSGGSNDILGSLLEGGRKNRGGLGGEGGLGGLLSGAIAKHAQAENRNVPDPRPDFSEYLPKETIQTEAADHATLMIRAMVNAAKSDGTLDKSEQDKIISKLGKVSQAEVEFLKNEFSAKLDAKGFARSIPDGMQQQIYAVSLVAIDLDTNKEAQYLHQLAQGLDIKPKIANAIHEQLGVRQIYA